MRYRRFTATCVLLSTLIASSACSGGNDDAGAGAPASTGDMASALAAPDDVMFAAMMVDHHRMGIELAELAAGKAVTPEVKALAQRAAQSQQADLPQLQAVAQKGNMMSQPPEAPIAQFNQQEMTELRALSGTAFDRRWLDVFSSHHMSAVMMANVALAGGGDAEEIAQKIHDEQVKDIAEMNTLRQRLPAG